MKVKEFQKSTFLQQQGISPKQLDEMNKANVTLIVPERFHKDYPKKRDITLLTVEEFISKIHTQLE